MRKLREKWKILPPDSSTVDGIKNILEYYEVTDDESVNFILSVLETTGLFWDTSPAKGTTAREINKKAEGFHEGMVKEDCLSEIDQTVRGGRVIPNDSDRGPRGEREVTHACRLIDCHLKQALKLPATSRWKCIADIINRLKGREYYYESVREKGVESVRKRLERAFEKDGPFDDDYKKRFSEFEVGLY